MTFVRMSLWIFFLCASKFWPWKWCYTTEYLNITNNHIKLFQWSLIFTVGFVILFVGLIGSMVIELFVWINVSAWLDACTLSVFGTDKASFRISAGGNVRWIFRLGSIELSVVEIWKWVDRNIKSMLNFLRLTLHWIPQSFSSVFAGFRIGEVDVNVCSSIVDTDNLNEQKERDWFFDIRSHSYGSLSSVRLSRIQSCKVRRRSLSI